jgi:hypothetical protein
MSEADPKGKLEALSIAYDAIGELVAAVYFIARDKVRSEDPIGPVQDVLRSVAGETGGQVQE